MKGRTMREVVTAHVEPVLVAAGFTAGQWRGSFTSTTFCADGEVYRDRHPRLATGPATAGRCVDVTVEGEPAGGIHRIAVEGEPLADVLRGAGLEDDARELPERLRLADPDADAQAIGAMVARLYGVTAPVT